MTSRALARLSVTVKLAVSPSSTVASPTESVGKGSSSTILPTPISGSSASVALIGSLSATVKLSSGSSVVSSLVCTSMNRSVTPAVKVSVPDVPTKSRLVCADPWCVW